MKSKHPVFHSGSRKSITIFFNDEAVEAFEGQTVAAALVNSGRWLLGTSRSKNQPRGVFCTQGWCTNCYIHHQGEARVLACRMKSYDGMKVYSNQGDPAVPEDDND
ncbi:(2Fe-2S)-binding protein [Alicyclobacillus tolerans]|uniref:(2Fe-2S)-binding protein n=1 Tax=Alicyclobacillus tolerans TaxID=90970 RepID=UPI001F296AFB|nr:(2Fe-2S)-binding protein [Alicyclobacillus tolerans]MCF8567964.1 (2Fe-2S)-binding protein [Alicyclobacillus tolerans]